MRVVIAACLALALAVIAALWISGADQVVMEWSLDGQREAQNAMARALRSLRAGEPAALIGLLGVCFAYGFFHAAGPGHGKLLIGAYGAARSVGAWRLSLVALASSLAQGGTAIALVGAGLLIFGWSRQQLTDAADHLFASLSATAIAALGLWLVWRGVSVLIRRNQSAQTNHTDAHDHGHDHKHGPDETYAACGHAHGPDPAEIAAARDWRELLALIGAVAIRPCTGALFLLIVAAQMNLFAIGIAGTIAMALGVSAVTITVALAAVGARQGVIGGLSKGAAQLARVQPWIEVSIGLAIAWTAGRIVFALI